MPDWTVPLSDVRLSEQEVTAVADVLRSGWLSQGPRVATFERALADIVGAAEAVAVASGTAALHLICVGLGLGPGDEVILPALTFAATAAVVRQVGASPVFADIVSPSAPWLSPAAVATALTPRTKAIIAVCYGGHPGELTALAELAAAHGLALIEDAAHGLGARVGDGRSVGCVGVAGAFSFFANKNLPLGEGGMVVTDDPELAARLRRLRSHGLSASTWGRYRGTDGDDDGGYDVIEAGFNYRLDEPRAALGTLLLARLERDNAARAALAATYAETLAPVEALSPALRQLSATGDGTSAWHLFPLVLGDGVDRAGFRRALAQHGIQTSVHYPALHRTTAFHAGEQVLEATESYAARTVTLPLFAHMTQAQLAAVTTAVTAVTRACGR